MMLNIIFLLVILLDSTIQWYIITKKKRKPNKALWFIARGVVFLVILNLFLVNGFMLYWTLPFMLVVYAWIFPTALNLMRGKYISYLSAKGSVYDKFILKYLDMDLWFLILMTLSIILTALQIAYGTVPFNQI